MSLADEITARDLWNPYDFANPVDDQQVFAGRNSELSDIKYYLRLAGKADRPINLVLTGPRSAGKTSLLNRIEFEAGAKGFCVARVDLNEGDASPFSLFYKIYDAVLFAAVTDGAFGGLSGQTYNEYRATIDGPPTGAALASELLFPRHYATAADGRGSLSEPTLKADLRTISNELTKPVVLLFDECDVLAESRVELEMLRNVFMNTPGYMLVFAGTPNLFPVMEDIFSPIIRQFKKISVERFNDVSDTDECIQNPLRKLGLDPEDVLKPNPLMLSFEIDRLSAGRPYEIQLLCHFMFKRVEDGDARNMAITLDVLDNVRKELENQDKGNDRPSVAALHQLSSHDFARLQALTEFRGTIEQLAARARLFGPTRVTLEELESSFARFSELGLLERDEDGTITFRGDQFDEVYARYYAAANETRLFIWQGSFQLEMGELLYRLLTKAGEVERVYLPPSPEEAKRRINDALTTLIGPEDELVTSISDAGTPLYSSILASYNRGSLTILSMRLALLGVEIEDWVVLTEGDVESLLDEQSLVDLSAAVDELGGTFDVEYFEKDLPPIEQLVARVERLASPNQLEEFAEDHFNVGFAHNQAGDYASTVREFELAFRLSGDPVYATSLAHARLLTHEWEAAEVSAIASRDLVTSMLNTDESNLDQYAFASYDLAVALAARGLVDSAAILLDECEATLEHIDPEHGHLAIPTALGSQFQITLVEEKQLIEALTEFRSLIAATS